MTKLPKQSKLQRAKKFALAAGLGLAVGVGCRLLPEPWQLPCAAAVKLLALLFGVQS